MVQPFAPFSQNYGQLAYDHTKTFNLSFSYKLPKPIHNNLILGEVINGWQISNYTTYEDGSPLQESTGGDLNAPVNQWKYTSGPYAGDPEQTFDYARRAANSRHRNGHLVWYQPRTQHACPC